MTAHSFFDRQGNPISVLQWGEMFERYEDRIVARDVVGRREIKTLWLGYVEPSDPSARMFGTALYRDGTYRFELDVYDTEAEALAGHARQVARLKEAGDDQ